MTIEEKEILKKENEEKKKYLWQYQEAKRGAENIEREIAQIRSMKMFPSMHYDDMPHGNEQKDLSDYMAAVDNLLSKLVKARYKRIELHTEILGKIEAMENENERTVLRLRYIQGFSWEKVCIEMEYEWAQVHRFHRNALKNIKIKDDTQ